MRSGDISQFLQPWMLLASNEHRPQTLLKILLWAGHPCSPATKYSAPKVNSAQLKKPSARATVRTLCGDSKKVRKIVRQLTSPLYSLENNALGKERRRDGWEEASWTEITLGSQRNMYCNRLHSQWVSGREGMLCAFGVGTWDHEEMTIPMSPHRNRKCGFHWPG